MKKTLALLLWSIAAPAAAQTWGHAHGGADGAGFAEVRTTPITVDTPRIKVSGLGAFAPGSGPVVGANGVAYLGTLDGQLIAINADGTRAGSVRLPDGPKILASPLVGADGSIYVAASMGGRPAANDHRTTRAWLYKFSPQLVQQWERALPVISHTSGAAVALNALAVGNSDLVLVAAVEGFTGGGYGVKMDGFSPAGLLLFSQTVGGAPNQPVASEGDWNWLNCVVLLFNACFGSHPVTSGRPPSQSLPLDAHASPIGIAIATDRTIVVTDGYSGVRGYSFSVPRGLTRTFEKIDSRLVTAAPAVLPNSRSVYAVQTVKDGGSPGAARIAFAGPSPEHVADINQSADPDSPATSWPVEAPATRLASGRVITLDYNGMLTAIDNVTPVIRADEGAQAIAGASASRTAVYLSTVTLLVSLDPTSLKQLGIFPWIGGGQSSVAIGADGRVYALAGDTLTIFNAAARVRRHPHVVGK